MTTILADAKLGVMVADSNVSDGDRVWKAKKIHRINGALVGLAGDVNEGAAFLMWFKAGMPQPRTFPFCGSSALILNDAGLYLFDADSPALAKVPGGIDTIGSGGMGAICAYEALGHQDPAKAVRIACKHDAGSRPPVRTYTL